MQGNKFARTVREYRCDVAGTWYMKKGEVSPSLNTTILVHTYIPIVLAFLWLLSPHQADPLHIASTREEVPHAFLQNKYISGH